jgi:cytochrome c-type biogenesis protein CcmH/NrfG
MFSARSTGRYLSAAKISGFALSLLSMAAVAVEPPAAVSAKTVPSGIARTAAQQCRAHASVSACDDALRWNPSDPSLLVAMGDALVRARRPADAVRAYQRAAALAPNTPGIEGKVQAAQVMSAKPKTKRAAGDTSEPALSGKRFSNSDPDTQTH